MSVSEHEHPRRLLWGPGSPPPRTPVHRLSTAPGDALVRARRGPPTSGSVRRGRSGPDAQAREILALAVPALGALVVEPLFLLTDTAIVGALGAGALAGLGLASAVLSTSSASSSSSPTGPPRRCPGGSARGTGRGRSRSGVDGLWLAVAVGAVLVAVGLPTVPGLVGLFGAGPEASDAARAYLSVRCSDPGDAGGPGSHRGAPRLQDTRTRWWWPPPVSTWNAVLSFLLVHGPGPVPGLGVEGSAWGTVVAQLGMAGWLVALVVRGARREGTSLRPHGAGVRAAAVAGVPLLLRTVTLRLALLATVWAAASTGTESLAAHQVVFTRLDVRGFVLDALAIAAQALTGRSLGAGDAEGARATTAADGALGRGRRGGARRAGGAASPWLPWLFSQDPEVRAGITGGLVVVGVTAPLAGYVFVLDGVLIGAGDGPYLARAGVVALLGYLPLLAVVPLAGLHGDDRAAACCGWRSPAATWRPGRSPRAAGQVGSLGGARRRLTTARRRGRPARCPDAPGRPPETGTARAGGQVEQVRQVTPRRRPRRSTR